MSGSQTSVPTSVPSVPSVPTNGSVVKQEFLSGSIGWEILFIFIAGMIGDMLVHAMVERTSYGQGLAPYYQALGEKFFIWPNPEWMEGMTKLKIASSTIQGAIWGGIACVIALLIAKLFLYAKEETENKI